jgi:hypothetical protein
VVVGGRERVFRERASNMAAWGRRKQGVCSIGKDHHASLTPAPACAAVIYALAWRQSPLDLRRRPKILPRLPFEIGAQRPCAGTCYKTGRAPADSWHLPLALSLRIRVFFCRTKQEAKSLSARWRITPGLSILLSQTFN